MGQLTTAYKAVKEALGGNVVAILSGVLLGWTIRRLLSNGEGYAAYAVKLCQCLWSNRLEFFRLEALKVFKWVLEVFSYGLSAMDCGV